MVSLAALWLPILVSAVIVFIASNILWMALPFWHRADYKKLPDEAGLLATLKNASPGQCMAIGMDWKTATPEQREAAHKGPAALLFVRNPSGFNFAKTVSLYFLY